ncbi:MAG: hypothetical protein LC799_08355 [Actinobacteria bacterium]|nr:hypothetical protein [Actinomycetota bacterium]
MKEAMWDVDDSDGMSFRDPRTRGAVDPNQPTLWGGAGAAPPELLELATQRLEESATSCDALGKWLLLETARWRSRDAKIAVCDLLEDGKVAVEPSGRLTKNSMIRLR